MWYNFLKFWYVVPSRTYIPWRSVVVAFICKAQQQKAMCASKKSSKVTIIYVVCLSLTQIRQKT